MVRLTITIRNQQLINSLLLLVSEEQTTTPRKTHYRISCSRRFAVIQIVAAE